MKNTRPFFFILLFILAACKSNIKTTQNTANFTSPEAGLLLKSGEKININLLLSDAEIDSIQYFIDTTKVITQADKLPISLNTENLPLGSRLITAKIFRKSIVEEVATNVVLIASKTPANYSYKIVHKFNHDTASYTEGLEYQNGFLYESDGEYGASSLRKTTLDGKIIQKIDLDKKYFGEGITLIDDKIIQLTYKEGVGFEYDKATFELTKTFPYNHTIEGWGLAYNGETIFNTDGSNKIYKLNPKTYQSTGFIEVYDDKGPVTQLNELEWVEGKLYANIYTSDLIAIINPNSGEVEAYINLITLPKGNLDDENNYVLNGIAYDSKGKRLFVTGKKWPNLFEISVIKK